ACALALAIAPSFGGAADPYEIYSIQAMTGGLSFVGKTGADALAAFEVASKHLPFIMGPTSAAECNAVYALAKAGPVIWCYSSAVNGTPGSFEYQTSATNYDYNVAAMRWLRGRGLTKIALITPTDATGQAYDRAIDAILQLPENKAITLVDREHFNPADVSVAEQISKIAAAHAQVLF